MFIDFLCRKCKENNIRVVFENRLDPDTPSSASITNRCIVVNTNWHSKDEVPFQFAHEISHILDGDDCDLSFYHATATRHSKIEYAANTGAIKLVLEYMSLNDISVVGTTFMDKFGIPNVLINAVEEEVGKYES